MRRRRGCVSRDSFGTDAFPDKVEDGPYGGIGRFPGAVKDVLRERGADKVVDETGGFRNVEWTELAGPYAVGKDGFSWSGTARVGRKAINPKWTPPPEMIERTPKYAKWANGMPGGIPQNPLGVRAIYLFNKSGDTGFRIHGSNAPGSIGSAASSGCVRMLNSEVINLYNMTRNGTKVIVI